MPSIKKQVFLCTLGTIFEWYEFTVFISLAPIIALLFFPNKTHFSAMMSVFVIFATGFIMRPIGALFFGHLGDTLGRKYTLLVTIFLMSSATLCIGLIPIATSFSTIALVVCRLIQGFATSGEYPGGLALLSEQRNSRHKGFITSFSIFATGAGCFAGALVYALIFKGLGNEKMIQWGWRIPFLLGAPLGVFGFILRKNILESFEFNKIKTEGLINRFPLIKLFTQYSKNLVVMLTIFILGNTLVYINFFYFSNYSLSVHHLSVAQSVNLYLMVTFVYSISLLISGFLSDYLNKKIMSMIICSLIVIFVYPLFEMAIGKNISLQFFGQGILSLLIGLLFAPLSFILTESFPTAVRYSGVSFTINIAASVFGGTAPIICGALTHVFGSPTAPAFYVFFLGIIAFLAIIYSHHQNPTLQCEPPTLTELKT